MSAALLFVALLVSQVDPNRVPPPESAAKAEEPLPFTLDDLAAGAKNDAFVDEFLSDKKLKLFGTVQGVERFAKEEDAPKNYRLVMGRLGRNENAVDVEVYCYFGETARKDLSLLEPDVSKVTVQGNCKTATLQAQTRGLGFLLVLENCKIVPTPAALQEPMRSPGPAIIPNITNEPPPRNPGPPPPPLPMQP